MIFETILLNVNKPETLYFTQQAPRNAEIGLKT